MPSRRDFLRPVLNSLQHQVDHLYVYCNYPPDADLPGVLYQDWITIQDSRDFGDLGCTGRFHFSWNQNHGYVFLVDDDIIYAPDYVGEMICGIERYSRKAVLSCHGGILPSQVADFTTQRQLYDFEEVIPTDRVVNIVGLGVSGFHSTTLNINIADFPSINRDDLWFAIKCQKERIPLVVMGRQKKLCRGLYDNYSLWKTEHRDKSFSLKQTQIAQTTAWKLMLPEPRPGLSILVSTAHDDLEQLQKTLNSLSALSLPGPVELIVSAGSTAARSDARLDQALNSLRKSMEVKSIRGIPGRGAGAYLRAGLNECSFDLVSMVGAGTVLTADYIRNQQRCVSDHPQYCLIECAPDGRAVTDRTHTGASVYISKRHVLQAVDATPDSDVGWDDAVSVLIERLIRNQLPVRTTSAKSKESPDSCGPAAAGIYSAFAPFARSSPMRFVQT